MDFSSSSSGKRCRACLQHSTFQMYLLLSNIKSEGIEQTLADIYHKCTELQYEPSDTYWDSVCRNCSDKLIEFYHFRKMCIDSYNSFKVQTIHIDESSSDYIEPNDVKPIMGFEYFEHERNYSVEDTVNILTGDYSIKIEDTEVQHDTNYDVQMVENRKTVDQPGKEAEKEEEEEDAVNNSSDSDDADFESLPELPIQLKVTKTENPSNKEQKKPRTMEYACDICPQKFFLKARHEAHMRKHKGLKQWQCSHCDKAYEKLCNLKTHISVHHLDKADEKMEFVCGYDNCGKVYTRKESIQRHMEQIHLGKKPIIPEPSASDFACDLCPRTFSVKSLHDAHMRKHQGLKKHQCLHCDKSYGKLFNLKTHIRVHHPDEADEKSEFVCGYENCGKKYIIKESLRRHMELKHLGMKYEYGNPKICEQCGKIFKTNDRLKLHSYVHSKETPYKCDICSKMLSCKYQLKIHKMRHDGIKNFVCPTCGLRKTTGKELRTHMKFTHGPNNQYPCNLCDMVFSRPANRNRHFKVVHCGVKAYKCSHCDKSFGKAETRDNHVMTHTGEKPHVCQFAKRDSFKSLHSESI